MWVQEDWFKEIQPVSFKQWGHQVSVVYLEGISTELSCCSAGPSGLARGATSFSTFNYNP